MCERDLEKERMCVCLFFACLFFLGGGGFFCFVFLFFVSFLGVGGVGFGGGGERACVEG